MNVRAALNEAKSRMRLESRGLARPALRGNRGASKRHKSLVKNVFSNIIVSFLFLLSLLV